MKPYLLALCGKEIDLGSPDSLASRGRGVAVAVASLPGNRSVFVTCRHNILNKVGLIIYDENGKGVEVESNSMTVLLPTRDDLDLILFVLPVTVPSERIRLSSQPIGKETALSHAQNIVWSEPESPSDVFAFSKATTRRADGRAICSMGSGIYEFVADDAAAKRAKEAGRQTFYNVLLMESRPGVSGSPLWDKYGAIRGIVCGGTSKNATVAKLIYLPVRHIESELKITLSNLRGK